MTRIASQLAKSLVRIPSVTPDSTPCLHMVQGILEDLGFAVTRKRFAEAGTSEVDNMYATVGTGAPHLLFAGHVDVVPTGDVEQWTYPPFSATEHDGYIYGRGICDMKGAIAAFISALSSFLKDTFTPELGRISLLLTGDEEGPAVNGTVKMMKYLAEQGGKWDACITGEPTNTNSLSDAIKVGRRGSLTGTISVKGKQGHVGYPHLAKNAAHVLVDALQGLKNLTLDKGNAHFDASSLQIVDISVPDPVKNNIPGGAEAVFNIRYSSEFTGTSLENFLRKYLDGILDTYVLDICVSAESFICPPSTLARTLADCVESITTKRPEYSTTGGTSDSRFIQEYCETVDYGLTNTTIHAVDERIPVAEIQQLSHIYLSFLQKYFSG